MTDTETSESAPKGTDYVSDRGFADFPIDEALLKGILEMGFTTATPVQAATIDAAVAGKDMIVRAKTGTGKTAAFGVPILELTPEKHRKPYAIVLEPTRELAQQTAEQFDAIARYKDIGIAVLVGGVAMGPQEDALANGAEVIVGTPGRVLDHIRRGNLDASGIQVACLDEADEMLSMGFFEDVNKILGATADGRQVLLFSATISADTERLVKKYLDEPEEIMLSTDADGVVNIHHALYETSAGLHKVRALLYVLDIENPDSAIIFCNTREDTATVATFLDRQGLDTQLISGELSQARRTAVMKEVKAGTVRSLVATDVAARGIDISDLSHVVNYALPGDPAVYLHRTGRTGRIGKKGTAISLVGATDLNTRRALENTHGIDFEVRELPSPEIAVRKRVERQAAQIKAAMGSMVFESYLPTVRALLERDDGQMLLAAALRAFFTWDRQNRAGAETAVQSLVRSRNEKEERRRDRRKERGGDRDRGGRRGGDRDRDRGRKRDRGERGDRDRSRGRKKEEAASSETEELDIDALLLLDDDAPATSEDKPKKRKKKRRKKKPAAEAASDAGASTEGESTESAPAPKADVDLDDIDALLLD
jgi:ATP-dependent RNA helicase DeaD